MRRWNSGAGKRIDYFNKKGENFLGGAVKLQEGDGVAKAVYLQLSPAASAPGIGGAMEISATSATAAGGPGLDGHPRFSSDIAAGQWSGLTPSGILRLDVAALEPEGDNSPLSVLPGFAILLSSGSGANAVTAVMRSGAAGPLLLPDREGTDGGLLVPRTVGIPLDAFVAVAPQLELTQLTGFALSFSTSPAIRVVLTSLEVDTQ